jgi:hypothetical protein
MSRHNAEADPQVQSLCARLPAASIALFCTFLHPVLRARREAAGKKQKVERRKQKTKSRYTSVHICKPEMKFSGWAVVKNSQKLYLFFTFSLPESWIAAVNPRATPASPEPG